jgi:hypothetical protein
VVFIPERFESMGILGSLERLSDRVWPRGRWEIGRVFEDEDEGRRTRTRRKNEE